MNAPIARRANGTVLPGTVLNGGGRPLNCITELRAKYSHRLPEFMDRLIELSKSPNESVALGALKDLLDRLLGKPAIFVDTTHTRVDVAQLYLQALKQANEPKVIEPSKDIPAPQPKVVTAHVVPSEQRLGTEDTGNGCGTETS